MDAQNQLTYDQKIKVLESKNHHLQTMNVELHQENKKLHILLKNQEEQFFNSQLYHDLVTQGQELLKHIAYLRKQLMSSNQKILEIEQGRIKEISEITAFYDQQIQEMLKEIKNLKIAQTENFFSAILQETLKQNDVSNIIQPYKSTIEELKAACQK